MYMIICTMYYEHNNLYNVHDNLYNVHDNLYNVHDNLYNVHDNLYNVHCSYNHCMTTRNSVTVTNLIDLRKLTYLQVKCFSCFYVICPNFLLISHYPPFIALLYFLLCLISPLFLSCMFYLFL